MSNEIQKARGVLAKWRKLAYDTAWEIDTNKPFSADLVGLFVEADHEYAVKFDEDEQPHISTARLIVGTAGNPELLDTIEEMLSRASDTGCFPHEGLYVYAQRFTAAIIAADERMRS